MPNVVLIHTVASNERVFGELCAEIMPDVPTRHLTDEGLLNDTIARGRLTDDVRQRFRARAEAARREGADIIMLTCSSIGPSADGLGEELGIPVLRVDEAMADRAVAVGSSIGVAATLATTLEPTADLIRRSARRVGKDVEVSTRLAEGAFDALRAGDPAGHDAKVLATLRDLAADVDVIVLAQASMARAMGGATSIDSGGRSVPVLTSPRLGVERLSEVAHGE